MSPVACLWLFVTVIALGVSVEDLGVSGRNDQGSTTTLTSSARNGFLCPNESLILTCVDNDSQNFGVWWRINETLFIPLIPENTTTCIVNETNGITATYGLLGNTTKSYLEFSNLPEGYLSVSCEIRKCDNISIIVQGNSLLPQVDEIDQNKSLGNLVHLKWAHESQHLIQFYEVETDDQIFEVNSTSIYIPTPPHCNTFQNVTVTPVDHCGKRGVSRSLNINCTSESSCATASNSASSLHLRQIHHVVGLLVAIFVLIMLDF